MNTSNSNDRPSYFNLIRLVCISTGCFGVTVSVIQLWESAMRQMSSPAMVAVKGGGVSVSDVTWLLQNLALASAGFWIFRLKEIGRLAILICTVYGLVTAVSYYLPESAYFPYIILPTFILLPLITGNLLVFVYFMRRDVKAYFRAER